MNRSGAWVKPSDDFLELVKDLNIEIPENFQGEKGLFKFIEENPELIKFLSNYFKNSINEIQNS
jgi:hypothetical protein